MSASVFPILPGNRTVPRTTVYKVVVEEAQSGRVDHTLLSSTPRYRWAYRFGGLRSWVAAPAPWAAYSEVSVVQYFFDAHYGNLDSFHITDPYDGTTDRVVRFVDSSLSLTRVASGVWSCEFDLISVI